MTAVEFLRRDEWTMGHGQCHSCCGNEPSDVWRRFAPYEYGHLPGCVLAEVIEDEGEFVMRVGMLQGPRYRDKQERAWWEKRKLQDAAFRERYKDIAKGES